MGVPAVPSRGVGTDFGFDLGFDWQYVVHGEQRYEYERPVYVGDALTGETTLEDAYQREGSQGGTMTFAVFRTDFEDADGEHVLSAYNTRIETGGAIQDDAAADGSGHERGDPDAVVEDVERRDFVKYAGASGDFNPIHYDEPYATDAGNPSVFGQGMFSAGVASRAVREHVGLDALASFQTRFTSRVFPDDTLRVFLDESGENGAIDVEVVTDDDRTVVEGSATSRE
ncbi:FAS1-like dehydratase domain-containing protein [Halospeciosus flavus]|uniref:FAS1-like dehydratase domain-containing protein n=1 Tax=Halospeciosus flavus TaxID=3032283 RepID=UPI0036D3F2CD